MQAEIYAHSGPRYGAGMAAGVAAGLRAEEDEYPDTASVSQAEVDLFAAEIQPKAAAYADGLTRPDQFADDMASAMRASSFLFGTVANRSVDIYTALWFVPGIVSCTKLTMPGSNE